MSDRTVCIVLHDAATSTRAACVRTLAAVREVAGDVPVTLLAVPRYHGEEPSKELEAWLGDRLGRGDELALHGHTHQDDGAPNGFLDGVRRSHYTRGEGEFWALSREEALARIDAGVAWFARNRWPLAGFVAPAWLLGPGAWAALAGRRFEYTSTLRQLIHLPGRQAISRKSGFAAFLDPLGGRASRSDDLGAITSQSVVYSTSSGWRRSTSLVWNGFVARAERGNPLLRIELHPRDADFTDIRRSWQGILERALRDRKARTVAEFMRVTWPAEAGPSTTWQTTTTAD